MSKGVFSGLIAEQNTGKLVLAIERAIITSFEEEQKRELILLTACVKNPTRDEIKRRTKICINIFRVLRGDLQWSFQRVVDHLAPFLRKELDGIDWVPDNRNCWIV